MKGQSTTEDSGSKGVDKVAVTPSTVSTRTFSLEDRDGLHDLLMNHQLFDGDCESDCSSVETSASLLEDTASGSLKFEDMIRYVEIVMDQIDEMPDSNNDNPAQSRRAQSDEHSYEFEEDSIGLARKRGIPFRSRSTRNAEPMDCSDPTDLENMQDESTVYSTEEQDITLALNDCPPRARSSRPNQNDVC